MPGQSVAKSCQKANRGKVLGREKEKRSIRVRDAAAARRSDEKAAGPPGNVGVSLQRHGGFIGALFSSASSGPLWTFPKESRKRANLGRRKTNKEIQRLVNFPPRQGDGARQLDLFKS
ncbi:hypothetical protein [Shinella zoogloeoides]|uniref:hypothetical protein n=1 Tax=Shinella zoogloeoides TaxID=352475 RepID=UPI0028AB6806|nr:hypothetical protein [Shinella zoogloeoides]